jgi:hypothetical protein
MVEIPELIEVWKIARAIGWPTKKTRLFLYDAGLAQKVGAHREVLVVRADFQASMPVVYEIYLKAHIAGKLLSSRGFARQSTGNLPIGDH